MLELLKKVYEEGKDAETLNIHDYNRDIFKMKSGEPIRLIKTSKSYKEIYEANTNFPFFENNNYFWMIPNQLPSGKLVGYILRGLKNKEYRSLFERDGKAPMFGFEDFENYELDTPIVLCEGVKDSILLKTVYPYTLALNTAGITLANLQILKCLTDKIVLCYDNDDAGINAVKKDLSLLGLNDIMATSVQPKHKDVAEYLEKEDKVGWKLFQGQLRGKLRIYGVEDDN